MISKDRFHTPPFLRFATACIWTALSISCGTPGSTTRNPCGAGSKAFAAESVADEAIFYLLSNFRDSTTVCALDATTGRTSPRLVMQSGSHDVLLLRQSAGAEDVAVIERYSRTERPSRLTLLQQRQAPSEFPNLPVNSYGLLQKGSDFIAVGFDRGDLARLPFPPDPSLLAQSSPVLVADLPEVDSSLGGVLSDGAGNLWAVSAGVDKNKGFIPTLARLHRVELQSSGKASRLESVDLVDAETGRACKNAFQMHPISSSSTLIACNPQFYGARKGEDVLLLLVDVSTGKAKIRQLKGVDGGDVQILFISGAVQLEERIYAFVEERTTGPGNWTGSAVKRSWIRVDAAGVDEKPVTEFGGEIAFFPRSKRVLSSCSVDAGSGRCKAGKWAISRPLGAAVPLSMDEIDMDLGAGTFSFARPYFRTE